MKIMIRFDTLLYFFKFYISLSGGIFTVYFMKCILNDFNASQTALLTLQQNSYVMFET